MNIEIPKDEDIEYLRISCNLFGLKEVEVKYFSKQKKRSKKK